MSHQVRVLSGPKTGAAVAVSESKPVFIGRDDACELAIPEDSTLSRTHVEVIFQANEWRLVNKSQHGTLMNGEVFQDKRQLAEGTEFQVGATKLVFEADPNPGSSSKSEAKDGDAAKQPSAVPEAVITIAEDKPSNLKWVVLGVVIALVLIGGAIAAFVLTR